MDRRDFLGKTFSLTVLAYLQGCSTNNINQKIIDSQMNFILSGDGKEILSRTENLYNLNTPVRTSLMIASLGDTIKTYSLPTPCKGHEIVLHPKLEGIVFASSKWGQESFLANYLTKNVIKTFKTGSDSLLFFGHAVFSSDGAKLYCTMTDYRTYTSYISVRDSTSLEEIKQIKTSGFEAHQLRWHVEDEVLAVINSKQTPSKADHNNNSILNFIDVNNSIVLDRINFSQNKYSHFTIFDKMGVACRSSGKVNPEKLVEIFNIISHEANVLNLDFIPQSEALSHVLLPSRKIAIITIINNNKILVWDLLQNKVLNVLDFNGGPRGVAISPDEKYIYISYVENDSSFVSKYETVDILSNDLSKVIVTVKSGSGSHLTLVRNS